MTRSPSETSAPTAPTDPRPQIQAATARARLSQLKGAARPPVRKGRAGH